jgi:hypothetical protein
MADKNKELSNLRKKLAGIIEINEVWTSLHEVCKSLGLSVEENPEGLGKAKYLSKVMQGNNDASIVSAAQKILLNYPSNRGTPSFTDLQEIQDSLWWIENNGVQKISNVTRFNIVESLNGEHFWGRVSFSDFLLTFFPSALSIGLPNIGSDGYFYKNSSTELFGSLLLGKKTSNIPPERLSVFNYFKLLGLPDWPDERFCMLVERILHPEVQSRDKQNVYFKRFDAILRIDGFELVEAGKQGGLPVYKVLKVSVGVKGAPKYIIFASSGPKPDIVVDDAINMNIRVVNNADKCLIYDEPPQNYDLTWQLLLEWWGKKEGVNPKSEKERRNFGLRLRETLQSDPEKLFFDNYFKEFKKKLGGNLPALIPQVYLHYDPRNQKERNVPVLVRQRMDFLMLLRNNVRIVFEIDGKQHYSDEEGNASPKLYADMVSEDRRIRLLGYEIYRFGGLEFVNPEDAKKMIVNFFNALFLLHGINIEES